MDNTTLPLIQVDLEIGPFSPTLFQLTLGGLLRSRREGRNYLHFGGSGVWKRTTLIGLHDVEKIVDLIFEAV